MKSIKMRYIQAKCLLGLLLGMALHWLPRRRPLWIIGERGTDALDNGKCMFLWLKEQKKPVDAVYFLTKDSPDRSFYPNTCDPRGFRAHYLLGRCNLIVSTQWRFYRYVSPLFMGNTGGKWLLKHFKRKQVFLQHGITINMVRSFTYAFAPFDLFICGAQQECEYVKAEFGFLPERVAYTGFCRFDKLHEFKTKRQILVMPTWRSWFNGMSMFEFEKTDYCKTYNQLLNSKELQTILEENDLSLVFFPHHDAQRYIAAFSCGENMLIAKEHDYDVQTLLKESIFLVTDYSSIFADFAYMKKPLAHFIFDMKDFREKHYQQGYYKYEDGLGYSAHDIPELIETIKQSALLDFKLEEKYERRITSFYPLYDTNNCQRVYDAIIKSGL